MRARSRVAQADSDLLMWDMSGCHIVHAAAGTRQKNSDRLDESGQGPTGPEAVVVRPGDWHDDAHARVIGAARD